MVVDASPEKQDKYVKYLNYHGLISPWLILYREQLWLIETRSRSYIDCTPWPVGHPNHKYNAEILKDWE